jgi:hypothetical protein
MFMMVKTVRKINYTSFLTDAKLSLTVILGYAYQVLTVCMTVSSQGV